MSKYHEVKTQYKDRDSLVAALAEMGYTTVEVHDEAVALVDYRGNQTHYLDQNGDKANVIVRRKHVGAAANDLGFVRRPDGTYSAVVSEYDSSRHNTGWLNQLNQHYTEKVVIKTAAKQGFKYLGKTKCPKTGRVQLRYLDTRA